MKARMLFHLSVKDLAVCKAKVGLVAFPKKEFALLNETYRCPRCTEIFNELCGPLKESRIQNGSSE